eukprot:1200547-Rhodomonas_salina.1
MAGDNLKIRESFAGSIYVDGATSASVSSKAEILELLLLGASARVRARVSGIGEKERGKVFRGLGSRVEGLGSRVGFLVRAKG